MHAGYQNSSSGDSKRQNSATFPSRRPLDFLPLSVLSYLKNLLTLLITDSILPPDFRILTLQKAGPQMGSIQSAASDFFSFFSALAALSSGVLLPAKYLLAGDHPLLSPYRGGNV